MGREVKRVPYNFNWSGTWWGYLLDALPCQLCRGSGKAPFPVDNGDGYESEYCLVCEGEGEARPVVEIPAGLGYQMWETCSEGSPISPVFETPEKLARWLADNKASAFADMTCTYEQWLAMIGEGSAPSAMFKPGEEMRSGVEAVSDGK